MNLIRIISRSVFAATLSTSIPTYAYDPETHREIGIAAASASTITSGNVLSRYGIATDRQYPSPSENATKTYLPRDLIGRGAVAEDTPKFRVVNHFYNAAQTGQGLSLPILGEVFLPSPDWALEDKGQKFLQEYAYADARNYLYAAITNTDAATRTTSFGLSATTDTRGRSRHRRCSVPISL